MAHGKFFCLLILTAFGGCVTRHPQVWEYYDFCQQRTSSFVAMTACAKATRNTYCAEHSSGCGAFGNNFVLYSDSLAASVNNNQITEAEAQRKWITFRMSQQNEADARRLQALQLMEMSRPAPAPAPITCYHTGSMTQCF